MFLYSSDLWNYVNVLQTYKIKKTDGKSKLKQKQKQTNPIILQINNITTLKGGMRKKKINLTLKNNILIEYPKDKDKKYIPIFHSDQQACFSQKCGLAVSKLCYVHLRTEKINILWTESPRFFVGWPWGLTLNLWRLFSGSWHTAPFIFKARINLMSNSSHTLHLISSVSDISTHILDHMIRSGLPGLSPYLKVNWSGTLITSAQFFTVVLILVFDRITGCYTRDWESWHTSQNSAYQRVTSKGHKTQPSININCQNIIVKVCGLQII